MRRLALLATAFWCAVGGAAETAPRNPFWPQGYEGVRHPITTEPRVRPQPKQAPAAKKKQPTERKISAETAAAYAARKAKEAARLAEEKLWTDARKTLKFGPAVSFSSKERVGAAVTIDGRAYCAGDLVSRTVGDNRFTWQIESISTNGKLKLKRLQHRSLTRKKEEK